MSWERILKKDFSVEPQGVRISENGFSDDYVQIARELEIPFARKTWSKGSSNARLYNTNMGKELQEIAAAMQKLGMNITFAKLIDEKYNMEDNPDGDGLYEHDVKSGVAAKIEYQGREKILYFVIYSEGAYTEAGDKPLFHIPRVLEDETVFTDVVLESLNLGEGPSKDPVRNDMDDDKDSYREWWNTLSRDEKIKESEAGSPPPEEYGRGPWPPKQDW
jgi:hypothetical protein